MRISEVSLLWKMNFCMLCLGIILYVIGFATNYLLSSSKGHTGLWEFCDEIQDKCYEHNKWSFYSDDEYKDPVLASKYMLITALCAKIAVILLDTFDIFLAKIRMLSLLAGCCAILGVLVALIGASVFVGRIKVYLDDKHYYYKFNVGFSFYLIMISCIVFIFTAIIHIIDARRKPEGPENSAVPFEGMQ